LEVGSSAVSVSPAASPLGGNLLVARRPVATDAHFDVTAMVDLVFMMNIFFLVTWVGANLAQPDLPAAKSSVPTEVEKSTVITVVAGGEYQGPTVYIGDVGEGPPLTDLEDAEKQVRAAAEAGLAAGKDTVLFKAEKQVRLREYKRVLESLGGVEGIKVRIGVMVKD
jgi:biopolymer transport protein ExbD